MKHFYTLTIVLALSVQHSLAQIVNLNWATSILHGWSNGATSGSANNIGGSSVNATISINNTQTASYGDFGLQVISQPSHQLSHNNYQQRKQTGCTYKIV